MDTRTILVIHLTNSNTVSSVHAHAVVHLGFCTRGGGGNRVLYRIVLLYGVRKHTQSRGSGGMPPRKVFKFTTSETVSGGS